MDVNAAIETTAGTGTRPSRLWLWFVAAFLVQAAMWTAWFMIAAHNKVAEVPLEGAVSFKR